MGSVAAAIASDDPTARITLAVHADADDPITGRLVEHIRAVETLWLVASEGAVPGIGREAAGLWREHFNPSDERAT